MYHEIFFGFKLHLKYNKEVELLNLMIISGNIDAGKHPKYKFLLTSSTRNLLYNKKRLLKRLFMDKILYATKSKSAMKACS